jgi:hypothetical protein
MSETALREALEAARPAATEPDWNDVLRRSRRGGRFVVPAAAVAVVAALLVVVPAFGIGDRLRSLVTGGPGPHLTFSTTLRRADHSVAGTFTIRTSILFRPVAGKPRPVGRRGRALTADWTFTGKATQITLGSGGAPTLVCRPCGSSGTLRLAGPFFRLFGPSAFVVAKTPDGTARGLLRLQRP